MFWSWNHFVSNVEYNLVLFKMKSSSSELAKFKKSLFEKHEQKAKIEFAKKEQNREKLKVSVKKWKQEIAEASFTTRLNNAKQQLVLKKYKKHKKRLSTSSIESGYKSC